MSAPARDRAAVAQIRGVKVVNPSSTPCCLDFAEELASGRRALESIDVNG